MAKSKRKGPNKRIQKRSNIKNMESRAETIVSDAFRAGGISGFYQSELLISNESYIRQLESQMDERRLRVFRAYMLKPVPALPRTGSNRDRFFIDALMNKYEESCRGAYIEATVGLLSEYVHKYLSEANDVDDMDKRMHLVVQRLREDHTDTDFSSYSDKMRSCLFTDPISLNMFLTIDWDHVLPGTNFFVWARNILEIIREVCDNDYLECLEQDRDGIINAIALVASKASKDVSKSVLKDLRGIVSDISLPPIFPSRPALTTVSPQSAQGASIQSALFPPATITTSLPKQSEDIMDAISSNSIATVTAIQIASGVSNADIHKAITESYTTPAILYTLLTLCAHYKGVGELPSFAGAVFQTLLFSASLSEMRPVTFTQEDNDRALSFNTSKSLSFCKNATRCDPDDRDSDYGDANIAQFIDAYAQAVVPPTLVLSLRWAGALEELGLSHDEAYALCGYIEGIRSLRPILSQLDGAHRIAATDAAAAEGLDVETDEERSRRIRSEIEEELSESITQAQEMKRQAEATNRQILREQRTTSYRAAKAEKQLQEASDKTIRLQKLVEQLQAENAELQNAIISMSDLDTSDDDTAVPSLQFPSDIGKGIKFNVFGGSRGWVNEMRQRFPYINFYDVDTMPNDELLENSDIVMLNTFVMAHKYYWIIQSVSKRRDVEVHYFKNKGVNRACEQILEVYQAYKGINNASCSG